MAAKFGELTAERRDRLIEAAIIALILLLAAAFRLVRIASLPPGLFQDEAINAINAQTILAGAPRMYYGEREPLYMYLAALGTLIFGATPLALRATSALVGLFGVASGGALARQLFGRRVGLLTAAGLAGSLWLTDLSRIGFRAITLPAVECLGLAVLWRTTRTGRPRDYLVGGSVLGLTLYTYLSARFLPFALAGFILVALVFQRRWLLPRLPGLCLAGLAAVVVDLPLGVYAWRHPEVLFGRPDQVALPSGAAYWPALLANVPRVLGMVAIHGDLNWRQNLSGVPVFDPLNAALFLFGVLVALRWRKPEALLTLVLAVVMLVPSILSVDAPHYLRTVGAAGALYALWALGVDRASRAIAGVVGSRLWLKSQEQERGTEAPGRVPIGLFSAPSLLPAFKPEAATHALAARERETMHGAHRAFRPETVATLLLAVALGVAIGRTAYDYFVIYARSPSLRGAFASDLTAVGQTLAASPVWRADPSNVYLPRSYDDNRGSIAYFLYPWLSPAQRPDWIDERSVGSFVDFAKTVPLPSEPSLYVVPADDTTTIPILGPGVQRVTPIFDRGQVTARAVLAEPVSGAAHPPQLARFGSWLDLDSASIDPRVATFGWRVVARPSYQPSIFVYVQDAQGHTIAQADEEIAYPIDAWKPGQQIVTRHQLHLPPGTPPGAYRVVVGVYDKASGKRETPTRGGQPAIDVGVGTLTLAGATPGVPAAGRAINQSLAPGLSLLGDDLPGGEVEAGTSVPITLVWQATGVSRPDDEIDIDLRSASGTTLTEWRGQPGGPAFPTAAWAPSQAIREIQDVRIPPTASGAVVVEVAARAVGASSLGPSVSLGQIAVKASSHVFAAPTPKEPLQAPFSGVGALLGADVPSNPVAPGGAVQVTLYWRASGATPGGYTVFVHVLDDQNQVVGQRDEPPVHGTRPTTGWIEGEYIVDPHQLTVDPRARSGVYTVEVGMYDPASGVRVATGTVDNRIVIGSVRVGPASVPGG